MSSLKPDSACVVGAGIIGSCAALHLQEAGVATTLLDQFRLPHRHGSSHGASRAFRMLGDEPLDRLDYSLEFWQDLQREFGETLCQRTGLLNFGTESDTYLEKYMAVLGEAGRPFQWLNSRQIRNRYPVLSYPDEWGAVFDPAGAILFADRCLAAVQSRFLGLGGVIRTVNVQGLEECSDRVRLRSDQPGVSFEFDAAALCPGPWTAKLLPQLAAVLTPIQVPVTYWRDPDGLHQASEGLPILFNARLADVYALPACETHGHMKVLYHGGPETGPGETDTSGLEPCIEKVRSYVERHLPKLDCSEPALLETCRYTMSPDNEPIIDRVSGRINVGCGFSGSGFKHAPATGRMLAALAMGCEHELPPGFVLPRYRLGRFL